MKYIETQNKTILKRTFIYEGVSNLILIIGIGMIIYWFNSKISGYLIGGILCFIFWLIGHLWNLQFVFDFETKSYIRIHQMLGISFKQQIWDFHEIESIYFTTITDFEGETKNDMDIYIKRDPAKYWVFFSEKDLEFIQRIEKMFDDLAKFSIPINRRNTRLKRYKKETKDGLID